MENIHFVQKINHWTSIVFVGRLIVLKISLWHFLLIPHSIQEEAYLLRTCVFA